MVRAALQFVAGIDTHPYKAALEELREEARKFGKEWGRMVLGVFAVDKVIEGFRGVAARPELEPVAIRRREPGDVRHPIAVPVPLMIPADR